jgi:hypothetical protein
MTINLKVEEHIYKKKFIFKIFFSYLENHYQSCQNNPLSMDPHSYYLYTYSYMWLLSTYYVLMFFISLGSSKRIILEFHLILSMSVTFY